ncbi:MAG: hypothetical protein Q9169_007054 [Polycauliona sp. 2 TL-2023]
MDHLIGTWHRTLSYPIQYWTLIPGATPTFRIEFESFREPNRYIQFVVTSSPIDSFYVFEGILLYQADTTDPNVRTQSHSLQGHTRPVNMSEGEDMYLEFEFEVLGLGAGPPGRGYGVLGTGKVKIKILSEDTDPEQMSDGATTLFGVGESVFDRLIGSAHILEKALTGLMFTWVDDKPRLTI